MRQRVGFARALVVEPDVLLMDEPFSALDVLTAENLRGELLEIWERREFPTQAIVMVTHNIEEAVLLADRIVVLGTEPGRIREQIQVALDRPRDRRAAAFEVLVDRIYSIMTGRETRATDRAGSAATAGARPSCSPTQPSTASPASPRSCHAAGGTTDLADLADDLSLEVDDLLPLVDACVLLGFADVDHGAGDAHPRRNRLRDRRHPDLQADLRRPPRSNASPRSARSAKASNAPTTALSAKDSSSTCSDATTARTRPAPNSTPRSTGDATPNSSNTTPISEEIALSVTDTNPDRI